MPASNTANSPAAALSPSLTSPFSASSPQPASARRARSRSPAHRASRSSRTNDSSKGSSPLPRTVRYLQQLSFRVISGRSSGVSRHVQYVLLVQRKQDKLPWTVSRSFSDYRALQKRLLAVMQLGHFCNANCPWLYSFMKGNFPKDFRLLASSKFVVGKRVDALTECFATLHAHLVDRRNHCCSIMTRAVAIEFIEFINADLPQSSDAHWSRFGDADASWLSADIDLSAAPPPLDISVRPATDLSNATTLSARSARSSQCSMCSLCSASVRNNGASSASLHGENNNADDVDGDGSNNSYNNNNGDGDDSSSSHSQSSWTSRVATDSKRFDAESLLPMALSTLSCGHEFHDECIVPHLNENMRCPTCGDTQAFC